VAAAMPVQFEVEDISRLHVQFMGQCGAVLMWRASDGAN